MSTEDLFESEMPEELPKRKRKRIYTPKKIDSGIPLTAITVFDPLAYEPNKCTANARKICSTNEEVIINVWGDKHYFDRHHQGSNDGAKRDGIDPSTIEDFIRRCVKHMFLYGSVCRGFKFVNFPGQPEDNIRIVLKEPFNGTMLNVVTETHFLEINKYEITVTTAMCVDDFRAQNGQYVIELNGDSSILLKKENRPTGSGLEEICSF